MVIKGEREWGSDKLGVWDLQIHTTIYKINNKVLLYSTVNYIQHLVINHNEKECNLGLLMAYLAYLVFMTFYIIFLGTNFSYIFN